MATVEEVAALAAEVSNWGRWEPDDERGTLNLIDDAAVRRGVESVVTGEAFSLAIPLDGSVPLLVGQPSRRPPERSSLFVNFAFTGDDAHGAFNDDAVTMGLQASTHWDALTHCTYGGQTYNGYDASTITAEGGASKCGIDKVGTVVSRGVLLDLVGDGDALPHGRAVTPDELDTAADAAAVTVEPGDIVLIRLGAMSRLRAGDRDFYERGSAGLAPECVRWFRRHDIAAWAIDAQNPEPFPPPPGECFLPIHMLCLRDLGMIQGQNWMLDDLAAACAADGRFSFLLSATPEPFTGASGAPVVPVAIR